MKQPTLGGLRKMGALTALSVVATLVMVSCGSSTAGSSAKPLFVGINKSADQQYFIDQQQAFKAEIEKKGGLISTGVLAIKYVDHSATGRSAVEIFRGRCA